MKIVFVQFCVFLPPLLNIFCFCWVHTIPVLYWAHFCMKCSLGVSNFLEEISCLSHSIVFLYFFAMITEEDFLISPCYSLELCIQMGISFLSSFAFTTMKPVFPVVSITCSFHRWILLSITALYKEQTCVVSIKEKNYCTCFMWNASSSAKLKETNRLNVLECCSHMEERPRVEPFRAAAWSCFEFLI